MSNQASEQHDEEFSWIPIGITLASLAALGIFSPWVLNIRLGFLLMQVVVISIVIWQVCDPFAEAAQWIGQTFRIPGSVRGATLDAVASSMPELFTGVFFVIVFVFNRDQAAEEVKGEGYGATLATCAGSAIYNMILIPAFCALVISFTRKNRPTIDVEREVISRDGLWFIFCEGLLIFFLFFNILYWWVAVIFLLLYVGYVTHLVIDARHYRRALAAIHAHIHEEIDEATPAEEIVAALKAEGVKASPALVEDIREKASQEEEETIQEASLLYGMFSIPLNMVSSFLIIGVSTLLAAGACYWLVKATEGTADELSILFNREVPLFFVAVILAAAASSVPDTFLSIGAAQRGDDSGAVSNAFGSNIFDICICLSIPLLVYSGLQNWGPVELEAESNPWELRILLAILTLATLGIMWHKFQLTRFKAIVLCLLYCVFMAYAILGSMDLTVSNLFDQWGGG